MSFLKSLVRRVKRTVKAQVQSQVTSFVGQAARGVTSAATDKLRSESRNLFSSIRNRATIREINNNVAKGRLPSGNRQGPGGFA